MGPPGPRPSSCSTPCPCPRSWATVVSQGRKRSPPGASSPPLELSNRYEALSQIVNSLVDGHGLHLALGAAAPPLPRTSAASAATQRELPILRRFPDELRNPATVFRTIHGSSPSTGWRAPSHLSNASKQENHSCALVLLVGSSMIRHVALHGGRTFCHPGAWVKEVTTSALQLSEQHCSASTMVLEAGINDLRFQQSEILKQEFATMIDRLLATEKRLIISGPPRYGDIITSRLRQLHLRLKGYCLMKSIPFVDNIFVFLNGPHLFKPGGIKAFISQH